MRAHMPAQLKYIKNPEGVEDPGVSAEFGDAHLRRPFPNMLLDFAVL